MICHTDVSSNNPPLKNFPASFNEPFNVKFDHAQHNTGAARPQRGCAGCHNAPIQRGAGLSIPANIAAHNNCYTCHTPSSKSNADARSHRAAFATISISTNEYQRALVPLLIPSHGPRRPRAARVC